MKIFAALILMGAVSLNAQTAKVIQLSPEDAATAKSIHDQQAALDKKRAEFQDSIKKRYLRVAKGDENHTMNYKSGEEWIWIKQGWNNGEFEMSEDFKFIVPAPYIVPKSNGYIYNCGGIFNTLPAVGILN